MHLSAYRLMWVIVMFDLPTATAKERKSYAKFRHFLLDLGFEMSQFSIYMRFCSGKEAAERLTRQIGQNLPPSGHVHVLCITDRQFETIARFTGRRRESPVKNPDQLALF